LAALDLSGYTLSFDDEFNTFSWNGGGNKGTWSTTYSYGERKLNDEQELYSDPTIGANPFSTQDGALVISATQSTDLTASEGQPYTSGVITTYGTFSQEYGYFEMRAKLPAGQGLWPAFWLLPVQHVWPPELDVFEAFGSEPYELHWGALTSTSLGNASNWVSLPANTTDSYHTYGVNWTSTTLTYYFDGQAIAQTPTPSDMNQPMYMIADLAVGGHWAGNPFPDTQFPAQMDIDYIRAYSNAPGAVAAVQQPISTPDAGVVEAPAAPATVSPQATGTPVNWLDQSTLVGGPGNNHFQTYYGDTRTRVSGPDDDTIVVTDPRMYIEEQPDQGHDLVDAWVDYMLPPNVANITAAASWGLRITGNSGSNFVTGGPGNDTLSGGAGGDDVLIGGGGQDTFVVTAGWGYDTITDFQTDAEHGTVQLDGYDSPDIASVLAALRSVGTGVVLYFDNGETLTFQDAQLSQFSASDFALTNVTAAPANPQPIPAQGAMDTLVVNLSEDSYDGDAQFTVTVDGHQLGRSQYSTAIHVNGQTEAFTFTGQFGAGSHQVVVSFLNDAWDGTSGNGHDRNLYVDSITYDGVQTPIGQVLYKDGSLSYSVQASSSPIPAPVPAPAPTPEPAPSSPLNSLLLDSSAAPPGSPQVSLIDETKSLSGTGTLVPYAGAVSYLQWQQTAVTSDNVVLATKAPNVFLKSGAGDDAIQVASGQNVLDGGSGSNFLVGGSGTDTFFLDARGGHATWDTVANFHAGDALTVWGFGTSDAFAFDVGISGTAGYEGATLRAKVDGTSQSVTFAGLSPANVATALSISTGTIDDLSYLYVAAK
jgi:beta-glucanase (GH16 family)